MLDRRPECEGADRGRNQHAGYIAYRHGCSDQTARPAMPRIMLQTTKSSQSPDSSMLFHRRSSQAARN
jgi:hypothetical protein